MNWRFGKNVVAAIALGLVVLVTWLVVQALRKPGSMSVIEAQSMDMHTMLPPEGAVPVGLACAQREHIVGAVTYTGTVQAYDDEDVYPRITGRIVEMPVYPGDYVRKGQLLVKLDPPENSEYFAKLQEAKWEAFSEMHNAEAEKEDYNKSRFELEAAQESEEAAKKALNEAKSKLIYWTPEIKREEKLVKDQVISHEEYDKEDSEYQSTLQMVAEAEAKLREAAKTTLAAQAAFRAAKHHMSHRFAMADKAKAAEKNAAIYDSYTRILAREDGVITKRLISPGVVVNPGMMILKAAHIKRVRLQAEVASDDIGHIRVGNNVAVKESESSARQMQAHVTSVFPAADPSSRTLIVEALMDNVLPGAPVQELSNTIENPPSVTKYRFLPGQYVVMTISTGEGDALTIPTSAIVWNEGKPQVWKAAGGTNASGQEYSCLMHPEVRRNKPGTCPKCGMKLEPVTKAGRMTADLVDIKIGLSNADRTQVTDGLNEGDQVVFAGFSNLRPGMPVVGTEWGKTGPLKLPGAAEAAGNRLDKSNNWHQQSTADNLKLDISMSPAPPKGGSNSLVVKVQQESGGPASGAQITAKTSMPTMSMPGPELTAASTGPGAYQMKSDFMSGLWKADLTISMGGKTHQVSVDIEVP